MFSSTTFVNFLTILLFQSYCYVPWRQCKLLLSYITFALGRYTGRNKLSPTVLCSYEGSCVCLMGNPTTLPASLCALGNQYGFRRRPVATPLFTVLTTYNTLETGRTSYLPPAAIAVQYLLYPITLVMQLTTLGLSIWYFVIPNMYLVFELLK